MMSKKENWYADLPGLLRAEALWHSGRYNEDAAIVLPVSKDFLRAFLAVFSFSESDVRPLFRITDTHGKLLLHESFINYLQRFAHTLQMEDTPDEHAACVSVRGPMLQLELLKLVLPDK